MAESPDKPNPKQLQVLGYVFDAVARLLPTEGRDFKTQVGFPGGGTQPRVTVVGLTPMGKVFADYCMQHIREEINALLRQEGMIDTLPAGSPPQTKKEEQDDRTGRSELITELDGDELAKRAIADQLRGVKLRPSIGIKGPGAGSDKGGSVPPPKRPPVSNSQRVL